MGGTVIYLRDKDLKLAQEMHLEPKDMVRMLFNAVREHPYSLHKWARMHYQTGSLP